jgi:Cys-rich repeat protein
MRHLLLLTLALTAGQTVSAQQGNGPICRNDFDCGSGSGAWCELGSCQYTPPTPPSTPAPDYSGWMCRNDWDCGQGEVCSAGSCSFVGGSSSSDFSSDGGSTPIFGG